MMISEADFAARLRAEASAASSDRPPRLLTPVDGTRRSWNRVVLAGAVLAVALGGIGTLAVQLGNSAPGTAVPPGAAPPSVDLPADVASIQAAMSDSLAVGDARYEGGTLADIDGCLGIDDRLLVLKRSFWTWNAQEQTLTSRTTGATYRIGDELPPLSGGSFGARSVQETSIELPSNCADFDGGAFVAGPPTAL